MIEFAPPRQLNRYAASKLEMEISSIEQLELVMSNLHDCPFDLDRAAFDETTRVWTGYFLRPLWDDPRAEHRRISIFSVRIQLPVVEVTLKFSGVDRCTVADDARIGQYSFTQTKPIPTGVRFEFNEALTLDFEFAGGVDATYEERPLAEICAVYQQNFLVQSGPFIETVAA